MKGFNWVTGPKSSQSAYGSVIAGVISSLTILDVFVRYHNITGGAVTITLDDKTAMDKSRGDWLLSINQKCFNFLQVTRALIKLSLLTFHFCHVKGHQTNKIPYNQLDWWGQRNEDVNRDSKVFLWMHMVGSLVDQKTHIQPLLHL